MVHAKTDLKFPSYLDALSVLIDFGGYDVVCAAVYAPRGENRVTSDLVGYLTLDGGVDIDRSNPEADEHEQFIRRIQLEAQV